LQLRSKGLQKVSRNKITSGECKQGQEYVNRLISVNFLIKAVKDKKFTKITKVPVTSWLLSRSETAKAVYLYNKKVLANFLVIVKIICLDCHLWTCFCNRMMPLSTLPSQSGSEGDEGGEGIKIKTICHCPYSPIFTPADFFLCLRVKPELADLLLP
jgi:hypothetical protein